MLACFAPSSKPQSPTRKFRDWEMPANSDSNFWTYLNERDPLDDAAAYQRYIGRMRDIPRYFDEHIANMRAGLNAASRRRKRRSPAATAPSLPSSSPQSKNAFYEAFRTDALDHQRGRPGKAAR